MPQSWSLKTGHLNLVAKGAGFHKETPVLLDFKGLTVFIQTDKPIYSPHEKGDLSFCKISA